MPTDPEIRPERPRPQPKPEQPLTTNVNQVKVPVWEAGKSVCLINNDRQAVVRWEAVVPNGVVVTATSHCYAKGPGSLDGGTIQLQLSVDTVSQDPWSGAIVRDPAQGSFDVRFPFPNPDPRNPGPIVPLRPPEPPFFEPPGAPDFKRSFHGESEPFVSGVVQKTDLTLNQRSSIVFEAKAIYKTSKSTDLGNIVLRVDVTKVL